MTLSSDEKKKLLAFVLQHSGWRVNYEKYMAARPIPELNWVPTDDDYINTHADDIYKTIEIVKRKIT